MFMNARYAKGEDIRRETIIMYDLFMYDLDSSLSLRYPPANAPIVVGTRYVKAFVTLNSVPKFG